ncbi:phage tail assembly chaperone [Pseudomonas asplenii]|uniref:phage tail assembly chaperone n=1 Tax=Pseudomonas asplenii TaxID=53407 RepID=UPI0006B42C58|nr:phage tail assembly chaperone [Pseudomonas fuscovaginae]
MKRLYSKSMLTTYIVGLHSSIPADAVEISDELYAAVIGNPVPGKVRVHDEQGLPYLVDAQEAPVDRSVVERAWRDAELSAVAWYRDRHRDQVEIGAETTLGADQFQELLVYMQALRDWPQSAAFPDLSARPQAPEFLESLGGGQ